jgi:polyhydroxyalkanoate synthesis regulator phasin
MARQAPDLLSKLVDRGEEALQRVAEAPGTHRMLETVTTLRSRVDDLQKRVRGLDALEKRVAALEKKVDTLSKRKPAAASSTARKAPAKKPAARASSSRKSA